MSFHITADLERDQGLVIFDKPRAIPRSLEWDPATKSTVPVIFVDEVIPPEPEGLDEMIQEEYRRLQDLVIMGMLMMDVPTGPWADATSTSQPSHTIS